MPLRVLPTNSSRRSLLKLVSQVPRNKWLSVRHTSTARKPSVPWMERPSCVFSAKALKHHWGAVPIIIVTVIGLTLEILALTRLALTRDDVYYTKTAPCEIVETRKGYKAPIRKFIVFNQKYENPPELIKALQGAEEAEE
ncbi:uncharacterized protein LOC132784778 [Drosophila nasuta]|uniref:uncharacterized protein LOC132784778 n=1 Tax=Drosophila nasuta TaxID=42062 RepID=UPI00295EE264|nr:uncharacterized protein LOC132784778 [Drosophila nasuta]